MRRSYSDRSGGDGYGHGGGYGGGYGGDRGGYRDGRDDGGRSRQEELEQPPHSRLFIIGGKTLTEKEFREAFGEYGTVERVDVKREKGISYVKFSKTSEAADAMDALNGKTIGTDPRPLKIVIASSKSQQSSSKGDITAVRLYLIIPKSLTEAQLREEFEEYGPLEYVSIVKDKSTNESRGFGYVKYFQFSHAARAFEGCSTNYKPKFADPRPSMEDRVRSSYGGGSSFGGSEYGHGGGRGGGRGDMNFETSMSNPSGTCKLSIMVNPMLNQDKVWKLFDIIPGLEHCEIYPPEAADRAYGTVVYSTPKAAAYAMEKLHGFDYPIGSRVLIKFEEGSFGNSGGFGTRGGMPEDVKNLVSTIQHATQLLAASGYVPPDALSSVGSSMLNIQESALDPSMCSPWLAENLPPGPVPMASMGATCEMRLFFVCKESRENPPPHILKDLFGRFGNLIEAYLMKNKNCGYAKYASKESALEAIRHLNEQTVMGSFLKVMEAEESSAKRPRMD